MAAFLLAKLRKTLAGGMGGREERMGRQGGIRGGMETKLCWPEAWEGTARPRYAELESPQIEDPLPKQHPSTQLDITW